MINNKVIVPYRIKQARTTRGYSMVELAELIGVTKQAISQYEMGKNEPSKQVLNSISNFLKYPISFFYKSMPINEAASSVIFFRSKKTTKIKSYNAAKEKMCIFEEIHKYINQFVDFPDANLPKIEYPDYGVDLLDNDIIENYAITLREFWNLGSGPIDNLMNVVQKNGIMISKMQLGLNKIDAFSVWRNTPYIFLSSDKDTNVRIRFDIAHELGHLILHTDYIGDEEISKDIIWSKIEDEANRFSGAFLLPKETFSKDIYSTSIDHFIQLKSKWKVSISCMINRCDTLGLLSPNQIKYLKDQMTARVYWRTEPLDNIMPIEKPFAHKQAIKLLLENNIVTPMQIVHDVGCYAEEIEEYCFLDKGTLAIKENTNVIKLKKIK